MISPSTATKTYGTLLWAKERRREEHCSEESMEYCGEREKALKASRATRMITD